MKLISRLWKKAQLYFRGNREKVIATVDDFKIVLNMKDRGISQALYYEGGREKAFMSLLRRTITEGMVCLDIGANIGYTTLNMIRCAGTSGIVYAVEPDPHNLELLRANISLNGYNNRCEIIEGIVSDTSGERDFWLADKPNINSVEKTKNSIRKISVHSYDFPALMTGRKPPEFIKMDVEGHEVKIFESALNHFQTEKGPVNILFEVHPSQYGLENDFAAILQKYFQNGFYTRYVISTPFARPRLFQEAGYAPVEVFETDGFQRGVYEGIKEEDVLKFSCQENTDGVYNKIVRALLLSRD